MGHDPAMRGIAGGKAAQGSAVSPSQMGCFEIGWLASESNPSARSRLQAGGPTGCRLAVHRDESCPTRPASQPPHHVVRTYASAKRQGHGNGSAASLPRSSGTPASFIPASASTSCSRLQSRQLPAQPGNTRDDHGLVADQLEGEADQDRHQDRQ